MGTYVNSCRDCEYCNEGLEVDCVKGSVYTFNAVDADGTITKGGYSSHIVVYERYESYDFNTFASINSCSNIIHD